MTKNIVVYPGSFNPITNGHTDLVERALHLFDHVILAIGTSAQKDPKVALADRIALCQDVAKQWGDRVSVEGFNTLLVDYVSAKGARFILRGLRTVTDFDYEFQMAEMNRSLAPHIECVFLPTSKDCSFISSTFSSCVISSITGCSVTSATFSTTSGSFMMPISLVNGSL